MEIKIFSTEKPVFDHTNARGVDLYFPPSVTGHGLAEAIKRRKEDGDKVQISYGDTIPPWWKSWDQGNPYGRDAFRFS